MRAPGTAQSYDDLTEGDDSLNRDYPRLYEAVRQRRPEFYSFRRNDNVGFLIPMSDDRTAMMWTTTALLDPDPVKGPLKEALADCEFFPSRRPDETGEAKMYRKCEMGPISFDDLSHTLVADYPSNDVMQDFQSMQLASVVNCKPDGSLCKTELRLLHDPPDDEEFKRIRDPPPSSTIKAAAIWDGVLWIRDINGQVWRYAVGID